MVDRREDEAFTAAVNAAWQALFDLGYASAGNFTVENGVLQIHISAMRLPGGGTWTANPGGKR